MGATATEHYITFQSGVIGVDGLSSAAPSPPCLSTPRPRFLCENFMRNTGVVQLQPVGPGEQPVSRNPAPDVFAGSTRPAHESWTAMPLKSGRALVFDLYPAFAEVANLG